MNEGMKMSKHARYVFVVKEEIKTRTKYSGTFDNYSNALDEYYKRIKSAPIKNVVSLQRVENFSLDGLDIRGRM
jgi:hypothetical protein